MKNLTQKEQERLLKIKNALTKGNLGIISLFLELENRIDKEIPDLAEVIKRMKGDKGDNYDLTEDDKKQIARDTLELLDTDKISKGLIKFLNKKELSGLVAKLIDKPKDGKTPTKKEIEAIIKPLIPVIKETPKEEVAILAKELVLKEIKIPKPDDSFDIRNKLEAIPEGKDQLAFGAIRESKDILKDIQELKLRPATIIEPVGMGGGTNVSVLEDGVTVNQSVTKINFGSGLDVTKTVNGVNITLDAAEPTNFTLQKVTDNGATTTQDITAKSFITTGGTSSGFVKGDGSLDTTTYLNTTTAGTTYVPYTGATTDVNLGSNSLSLDKRISLVNTTSSDTGVIYKGTTPFIHNFSHPTGDTVIPVGANTFVGLNAGNFTMGSTAAYNYHGSCNTGIGSAALTSNTTGFRNVAVGTNSLCANTSGYYNTAVGALSAYLNTGCFNSSVGTYALASNTLGCNNTALGYNSGRYISDDSTPNSASHFSLYLGSNTKPLADGDTNEIVIGYNAIGAGSNTATLGNTDITKTILRGNVGIGTTTPSQALDIVGNININGSSAYLYDGHNAIKLATKGDTVDYTSTIIGRGAGDSVTDGTTIRQTAVGYFAGYGNAGNYQTTLGYSAGLSNTGAYQTAVGHAAGYRNTGASQTALGYLAGYCNTGASQTALGVCAGRSNTGNYQTALGMYAGCGNTGANQTALGYYAGNLNTGANQTAVGYSAGYGNTGVNQTALGYYAGLGNTGASQTAVGYAAGQSNTGANVTGIGFEATRGNQANDVVAIGYRAGKDNALANQFIVKQANINATPLIQGDFVSGNVKLPADNASLVLGAGGDASVYYNGTNLIINPKLVGSGILDVAGVLQTDGYNSASGNAGASGSFTTADSKTVTVEDGIIISIV